MEITTIETIGTDRTRKIISRTFRDTVEFEGLTLTYEIVKDVDKTTELVTENEIKEAFEKFLKLNDNFVLI